MSVLIDTAVWSLGLRRKFRDLSAGESPAYFAWETLLKRGHAEIIGPIRTEVLSGIAVPGHFAQLRLHLASIPDLELTTDVFILAAEFFNTCRAAGVTPGSVDMMICAAAYTHAIPLFTTDPDFQGYARHIPIDLFTP